MNKCLTVFTKLSKKYLTKAEQTEMHDKLINKAERYIKENIKDPYKLALKDVQEDIIKTQALYKRREIVNAHIYKDTKSFVKGLVDDGYNEGKAMEAFFIGGLKHAKGSAESLDSVIKFERNQLLGVIDKRRGDWNTIGKRPTQVDIVKELFNEDSKNSFAKKVAKELKDQFEETRVRLNGYGADIGKIEEYAFKQSHVPYKMLKVTKKNNFADKKLYKSVHEAKGKQATKFEKAYHEWREFELPLLDMAKILGKEATEKEVNKFMRSTYEALVTGVRLGSNNASIASVTAAEQTGKASFASKISKSRLLHYKDGESYYKHIERYGDGNLENALVSYADRTGRQIGLLSKLGSNPRGMFDKIKKEILEESRRNLKEEKTIKKIGESLESADSYLKYFLGEDAASSMGAIGESLAIARQSLSLSVLGNTVSASLGDLATQQMAFQRIGLPLMQRIRNILPDYRIFNGMKQTDRAEFASKLGIFSEAVIYQSSRWSQLDNVHTKLSKLNNLQFKIQGQHLHDSSIRAGVGRVISSWLGDNATKNYLQLNKQLRTKLKDYGISAGEWDIIKHANTTFKKQKYIAVEGIDNVSDTTIATYAKTQGLSNQEAKNRLKQKLGSFLMGESELGLEVGAWINGYKSGNHTIDMLMKSVFQFMTFPANLTRKYLASAVINREYSAMLPILAFHIAAGYLVVSAKSLVQGRTPPDPTNIKTFYASLTSGLAVPYFADFVVGAIEADDRKTESMLNVPVLKSMVNPATDVTFGLLNGDSKRVKKGIFLGLRHNLPFHNLPYIAPVLKYGFYDPLEDVLRPGQRKKREEWYKKNMGSKQLFE